MKGELLGVTLPDRRNIEYVHDPLGRRIAKLVNGEVVEKYLWQGLTRLLAIYDGSDNLLMRFEYADARMPIAMSKSGVMYYLICDQVGSLKWIVDGAGNVVKKIEYDSFGNILNESNPAFTVPFGFAGGLHDRDTGLVRFGYRDYDPDTGRWTAKDPIGFAGGDTDLFGYCLNDPVNRIDQNGLLSFWGGVAGGIVGGLVGAIAGLANENVSEESLFDSTMDGVTAGFISGSIDVKAVIGAGIAAAIAAANEIGHEKNPGAIIGAAFGGAIGGIIASEIGGIEGVIVGTLSGSLKAMAFSILGSELYNMFFRQNSVPCE